MTGEPARPGMDPDPPSSGSGWAGLQDLAGAICFLVVMTSCLGPIGLIIALVVIFKK